MAWRPPVGEAFNVGTAILGGAGALAAGAWLLLQARSTLAIAVLALYASTMVILFAATALHHAFPASEPLRRLDHAAIYFAIIGTAAPPCLLPRADAFSLIAFGLTAALALMGAAHRLAARLPGDLASVALYLPVPIPAAMAVAQRTPLPAAMALAGAGACFVAGAIIDARGRPAPRSVGAHGVFHILVLAGSVLSFVVVAAAAGSAP